MLEPKLYFHSIDTYLHLNFIFILLKFYFQRAFFTAVHFWYSTLHLLYFSANDLFTFCKYLVSLLLELNSQEFATRMWARYQHIFKHHSNDNETARWKYFTKWFRKRKYQRMKFDLSWHFGFKERVEYYNLSNQQKAI